MTTDYSHQPVLLDECLHALNLKPEGLYIDATFGRGGHSRAILQQLAPAGRLIGVDQDPQAILAAQALAAEDARLSVLHQRFDHLPTHLHELGWFGKVDGLLMDLGVSSPQLDDAARGFSFLRDGLLDMRMNPQHGQSAAQWLQHAKQQEIADVLHEYGEERFARRLAKAIVQARGEQPLTHTVQLANIIAAAHPAWEKHKHPATRSFQAIRIYLNRELEALHNLLTQVPDMLSSGGRLLVISFHSLEDRLVKRFIREQARGVDLPPDLPVQDAQLQRTLRPIGKAIHAREAEIRANPRARSAVLRVAERRAENL